MKFSPKESAIIEHMSNIGRGTIVANSNPMTKGVLGSLHHKGILEPTNERINYYRGIPETNSVLRQTEAVYDITPLGRQVMGLE